MARQNLCVGIDIGASSVKLCQLKRSGRGYAVKHYGSAPLPADTVVDGTLMSSARVVETLQELSRKLHVKHKQVALAISGHAVIIKKVSLPQMTRKDLESSVQTEAEALIPFDIKDVFVDAHIVGPTPNKKNQMDVLFIAAKKDFVGEYTSVVLEAGFEPVVCDVDAFALQTAFEANYDVPADQSVVLVNTGASKTNINIIRNHTSLFTRDISTGGLSFTAQIQKFMGVSQDEAESFKLSFSFEDTRTRSLMTEGFREMAEALSTDVQRSIEFYTSSSAEAPPTGIYLSGGSALLPQLSQVMQERSGVPVFIADAFRKVAPGMLRPEDLAVAGPTACVAVGLALRYPGDG